MDQRPDIEPEDPDHLAGRGPAGEQDELRQEWDYDEDGPSVVHDLISIALLGLILAVLTPWLFQAFVAMWWIFWPA